MLAAALNFSWPLPEPLAVVNVNQEAVEALAVHEHPVGVVTSTGLAVDSSAVTDTAVGASV